jgi:hypothetical protein
MQVLRVLEWKYSTISVGNGTAAPPQEFRNGPKRIEVRCSCGAQFIANESFVELRKG